MRNVFSPCSQMGTPAGLRLNKQYNLDTFSYNSVFRRHIKRNIFARFGRRTLRSTLVLLSVVGAIARASRRKEVGLLRPGPRGPKVLRHQMVR